MSMLSGKVGKAVSITLLLKAPFTSGAFYQHSVRSHLIHLRSPETNIKYLSQRRIKTFLSSSLMDPSPQSEDDVFKWERMYSGGKSSTTSDSIDVKATPVMSEVRVITFDLDNTLWKTSEVIGAANNALAAHLDEMNIVQPKRTEQVMGDLFKADQERYAPILKDGQSNDRKNAGPVYLTQLRKDALFFICTEYNGYSTEDAESFANDAFEVWTNARHAAIPLNFASSVISCMEKIRSMKTASGYPVIVGAITDGNSNPLIVSELQHFFDFCVNAEFVGISKPDRKIYETAVMKVAEMENVKDIFGERDATQALTKDMIEDLVGPWWVHIGDHFIKDIVAAKSMNMRTIWARELVLPKDFQIDGEKDVTTKDVTTTDVEEFERKVANMKTINMNIGSDDFLLHSMENEFADSVVYKFNDIYEVLVKWREECLMANKEATSNAVDTTADIANDGESDILTVVYPDEPSKESSSLVPDEASDQKQYSTKMKFCVHCGSKLPFEANFCSSCGQKQPLLQS